MELTATGKGYLPDSLCVQKTLFKMKRLTILILVACLQLSAKSYAQKTTLLLKDAPLEQAFFLIQKQSPYRFIYTKEELEAAKRISIDVRSEEAENVLQRGSAR